MPLVNLDLPIGDVSLPHDVRVFLREADRRIERFHLDHLIPGFVPSDFAGTYCVLRELAAVGLAPGSLFCEWGSGFGVVACLAAMLDYDASGIEVEGELVDAARELAEDFDLPVEFVRGSFIPKGGEFCTEAGDGFAWLAMDVDHPDAEMSLEPDDFDVIFAYPWPDEERMSGALFERYAEAGAVLLTYHACGDFRLRRKKAARSARR